MMNIVTIVTADQATAMTHGGVFHADEVFATAMLCAVSDVRLSRVFRVPEDTTALVYDIGGGEYDHHQKGGNGAREDGTPYASAGLVWRDFGKDVVKSYGVSEEDLQTVVDRVDRSLIKWIDAVDNGYGEPAGASVSSAVSAFNPNWDEEATADEKFLQAVEFASGILEREILSAASAVRAQGLVTKALESAQGHVMVLDRFMPWQEPLFEADAEESIWYVVFPSNRGGYNVQCVPDEPGSFGQRHPLPAEWKGNAAATGIADCTFVHNAGFIAACNTLEGALSLAEKAASV